MHAIRSNQVKKVQTFDDFSFSFCDKNQLPGFTIKILNFCESLKEMKSWINLVNRNIKKEKILLSHYEFLLKRD